MILDMTTLFSDAQAITASAISTNVLDTLPPGRVYGAVADLTKDIGKGNKIPILIQVVEDFATLTSLTVEIRVSANENMTSHKVLLSQTIAVADLKAGKNFAFMCVPPGADRRYMAIQYTVGGSNATAGKVTAGIALGIQTNSAAF